MTLAEALRSIRGYAGAGRIEYTLHAERRMAERHVSYGDVRRALSNATRCKDQRDGTWRTVGPDMDGEDLAVVVSIEDGLMVVTLF